MLTDFNNHCLPMLYDGPACPEDIPYLFKILKENNFNRVFFTPDYHKSSESITFFLNRRKQAFAAIRSQIPSCIRTRCAARVLIERFSMADESIRRLTVRGTDYMFIELPILYESEWIESEIHCMLYKRKIKPIFTSFQRVVKNYPKDVVSRFTNIADAAFQFDLNCIYDKKILSYIRILVKKGKYVLPGTYKFDISTLRAFEYMSDYMGEELLAVMNKRSGSFLI